MALFTQSTKTLITAKTEVAASSGSDDTEELAKAVLSIAAAAQHFNNLRNWNALLVEADGISVVAPFTVGDCTITAANTVTSSNSFATAGVVVDDHVSGGTLVLDTQVDAIPGMTITVNRTQTVNASPFTATFVRDIYTLPTNFKAIYSARLMTHERPLWHIGRRLYDRIQFNQTSTSHPEAYDLFSVGERGKIRLIPPPGSADVIKLRYYRRIDPASATLDIPEDWEPSFIAWAKWHYLTDKGGGDNNARAQSWNQFAQEGIARLISQETKVPDEDLAFQPGFATVEPSYSPNSIWPYWGIT